MVDRAKQRVSDHLAQCPNSYVSWSGGKDSTVVAAMANDAQPRIPIVHYASGLDFPETLEYQDDLSSACEWNFDRIQTGDITEHMVAGGSWEHGNDRTHDNQAFFWDAIKGPEAEARQRYGDSVLWGLRASESKRRHAMLSKTGGRHHRSDGVTTCAPIWDWFDADVWAYLSSRGLPANPVYQRLAEVGCPPEAQRVSVIVDSGGVRRGRMVWLRRGWPDLWRKYTEMFPRLKEFG